MTEASFPQRIRAASLQGPPARRPGPWRLALSLALSLVLSLSAILILTLATGAPPTLAATGDGSSKAGSGTGSGSGTVDDLKQLNPMEALGGILGAMSGKQNRAPVDREKLRALLPEAAGGERRTRFKSGVNELMGFSSPYVEADYGKDQRRITIKLTDMGSLGAMTASMGQISEEETDTRTERNWREGGDYYQQTTNSQSKLVKYGITFGSGIVLETDARGFTPEEVLAIVKSIGPEKIQALTN